jgi:hypothetical protein
MSLPRFSAPHFSATRLAFAIAAISSSMATMAAPASDSAYATDPQHSFVEDATSRGISQVNSITCYISSMAPAKMVNEGNYIALVDEGKCDSNSRSDSTNSDSSSSSSQQSTDYMTAYVNSSRASNDDPMVVRVWVPEDMDGTQATIYVRAEAASAPTANNPYGDFRMDFCGRIDDMFNIGCVMKGFIDASAQGLTFFQQEGGFGEHAKTTALQMTSAGAGNGSGRLYIREEGEGGPNDIAEEEFDFAFNGTHFLRGDQCFSRDANDADMSVWRYGVYDASTGARVELNSGFPIEYTPTGGDHAYRGYLGYYGLQLPGEAMAALSQEENPQVTRVEYRQNDEPLRTNYDVVQNGGKLMKFTKQTTTLAAIDKVRFSVFVNDNATEFFAQAQNFTQYDAYWDNTAGKIKVTGKFECNQNGCQQQSFESEVEGSISYFATRGGVRGWSQSLGGELFIDITSGGAINASETDVIYRTQDVVYPSLMPATLYCLNDCPTADSIAAFINHTQQTPMTLASNWAPTPAGNVVSYTTGNGILVDAADGQIIMTNGEVLQGFPQYRNGIRSGRLFTDLASTECAPTSGDYCDNKVFNLDVYYVWETGPNPYNQFAAVKNAQGEYVQFDAPQQFSYTVPQGARYGEFAGQNIVLEYGGFGNLWGIPGHCVSSLTNAPVSCDTPNARYVPAFAIPGGASVTRNGQTYLVKWLEREIRFARQNIAECAALNLPGDGDVMLPTVEDINDPSNADDDAHYIGTRPEIDAAPRVIQGDVMY